MRLWSPALAVKKNKIQKWPPWGALYVTQLCIAQLATPAGQPFWNVSTIKPAKDSMCRTLRCQTPLVLILFVVKLLSKGKGIYNCLYTPGEATVNLSLSISFSPPLFPNLNTFLSLYVPSPSVSLSPHLSFSISLCADGFSPKVHWVGKWMATFRWAGRRALGHG